MQVQERFPSLFINMVTFIRATLSRQTSFKIVSNTLWLLCSAFARDLPSLWKRALLSSSLLVVADNLGELVEGWLSSPVQFVPCNMPLCLPGSQNSQLQQLDYFLTASL